jgi:hypothetical protein
MDALGAEKANVRRTRTDLLTRESDRNRVLSDPAAWCEDKRLADRLLLGRGQAESRLRQERLKAYNANRDLPNQVHTLNIERPKHEQTAMRGCRGRPAECVQSAYRPMQRLESVDVHRAGHQPQVRQGRWHPDTVVAEVSEGGPLSRVLIERRVTSLY